MLKISKTSKTSKKYYNNFKNFQFSEMRKIVELSTLLKSYLFLSVLRQRVSLPE